MPATANTSRTYWVLGHQVRPIPAPGDLGLVEILSLPGVPGPPPHFHEDASEFFYIVEGVLDVQVEGEWMRLETGQNLTLDPGQVHTLMNRSETPCRWITGWSPRGFEAFFPEFGIDADQVEAQPSSVSEEILGRVARESARFGMIVPQE